MSEFTESSSPPEDSLPSAEERRRRIIFSGIVPTHQAVESDEWFVLEIVADDQVRVGSRVAEFGPYELQTLNGLLEMGVPSTLEEIRASTLRLDESDRSDWFGKALLMLTAKFHQAAEHDLLTLSDEKLGFIYGTVIEDLRPPESYSLTPEETMAGFMDFSRAPATFVDPEQAIEIKVIDENTLEGPTGLRYSFIAKQIFVLNRLGLHRDRPIKVDEIRKGFYEIAKKNHELNNPDEPPLTLIKSNDSFGAALNALRQNLVRRLGVNTELIFRSGVAHSGSYRLNPNIVFVDASGNRLSPFRDELTDIDRIEREELEELRQAELEAERRASDIALARNGEVVIRLNQGDKQEATEVDIYLAQRQLHTRGNNVPKAVIDTDDPQAIRQAAMKVIETPSKEVSLRALEALSWRFGIPSQQINIAPRDKDLWGKAQAEGGLDAETIGFIMGFTSPSDVEALVREVLKTFEPKK